MPDRCEITHHATGPIATVADVYERDDFGVPSNMFGAVPPDFDGALGRIAAVGSLLEMRFAVAVAKVLGRHPDQTAGQSVGALNGLLTDIELSQGFETLRAQAVELMGRRNEHIHSLWPSPTEIHAYGWRAVVAKHRTEEGNSAVHITTNLTDMKALILQLADVATALRDYS